MVTQKSEPEKEIEIVSKKSPLGVYKLENAKVTFKKDTFGNDEYAFYNDKQIIFITAGNPAKYGKNSVAFDSVSASYDAIKNFVFDVEIELKEITIGDNTIRYFDVKHIWLKSKIEKSTSEIIIDGLPGTSEEYNKDVFEYIKKTGYVQISDLMNKFNPNDVSLTLKYLMAQNVIENKNGWVKYDAQKEL